MELENINNELKQNSQFLQDLLVDEIIKENLLKTGKLAQSIQVNGKEEKDGVEYTIEMLEYGFYQDSGVRGVGSNRRFSPNPESYFSAGTFSFKKPTIPWKPRTIFSFPAAKSIAQEGLRPRPFISEALKRFEEITFKTIEGAGVLDVEDKIGEIVVKNGGTI